jgi:hypothetical protein
MRYLAKTTAARVLGSTVRRRVKVSPARSGNFPKSWVLACAALLFVGCAAPRSEWKSGGYYITDQSIYGCDSFEGKKGTVMKKAAVLSLSLQRRLLKLLDQAASADRSLLEELDNYRDQPVCWYETPEQDIQLSLGVFCDGPFRITFHARAEEWVITSASRAVVIC